MDAATAPSSVAVVRGDTVLAHRLGPFGPKTDAWILAAATDALEEAGLRIRDLDCIAAGNGPGTFTGIRVALAAALGLGAGSGVPVCGIGNLEALLEGGQAAAGREADLDLVALIDARRGQHYVLRGLVPAAPGAVREIWSAAPIGTEELEARLLEDPPAGVVGADLDLPAEVQRLEPPPLAVSIARLAARMPPDARPAPTPNYLRPPDAVPAVSPLRRRRL
jgi:tRNA threonylcarbamoyladenosine biosynthesis protein TsaB